LPRQAILKAKTLKNLLAVKTGMLVGLLLLFAGDMRQGHRPHRHLHHSAGKLTGVMAISMEAR